MAENLTTLICRWSWNLGASTSQNFRGLPRLVQGLLYLFCILPEERNDRRCKVTVKIRSLWTSWRHVRGMKVELHAFLMSALDGRESSATPSAALPTGTQPAVKHDSKFCGLSSRCRHSGEEERFIAPVSYRAAVLRESILCPIHYIDWDNQHRKQKRLWPNFRFSTILQINWTDWEKKWKVTGCSATRLQKSLSVHTLRSVNSPCKCPHLSKTPAISENVLGRNILKNEDRVRSNTEERSFLQSQCVRPACSRTGIKALLSLNYNFIFYSTNRLKVGRVA